MIKQAVDELADLQARSASLYEAKMMALASAILWDGMDERNRKLRSLAQLIGESMALADLLGRKRLLMEFDRFDEPEPVVEETQIVALAETPVLPHIPFGEAVEDIVSREPRLAETWRVVSDVYKRVHAFTMAKSSELSLTKRIQAMIGEFLRGGTTPQQAAEQITQEGVTREIGGWTHAYAETVFETNMNTAYNAGRAKQARDPGIRRVMPAFRFVSAKLTTTRENHESAHGLIAATDDAIWEGLYPPLGFRCKCSTRLMSKAELRRLNLLTPRGQVIPFHPASIGMAHRDEGFSGGRPDRVIYG